MAQTATFDDMREAQQNTRVPSRGRLFAGLGTLLVIAAVGAGAWWYFVGSRSVSTDDAYVTATVALITPRIEGTLASVPVHDTQFVRAGDVLATLDPTDAQIAVAQAEADLERARQHVAQYFANVDSAKADVIAKQSDLARAQTDFDRRNSLRQTGAVSGDEITAARNTLDTAGAALAASRHQLASQQALIGDTDAAHNPEVLAALAVLSKARVDLARTIIRAPIGGLVAQSTAQIGQHVKPDASLMTVVPLDAVYVEANFKEGQLDHVRPGQPVTLTSDLYGSGIVFHGHVVGIGGGTGAAFAVIPAQNATGNWIKVVQRLPVRIALDSRELNEHPLRVGLSMDATVSLAD